MTKPKLRLIGIDTGGTFTDLVLADGDKLEVHKVPSTPADPARAIQNALAPFLAARTKRSGNHVVHGTTVALNALLTGRTAKVALVTNEGFRDLIEIGRQERPDIYALHPVKTEPLVPRSRRFEIRQRSWPNESGTLTTIDEPTAAELKDLLERVKRAGAESIAVCLLHAWADPAIEQSIATALIPLDLPLTTSAGILGQHREFERFSTAIVNAALTPLMRSYLANLGDRIDAESLSILQSTGGTLSAARAAEEPVRVLLSGPAGGVIGAANAAREAGFEAFCGLDMGGTSTDVAFHDSRSEDRVPTRALEPLHIAGHPIAVPSLDIHTIGCGGGSLVTIDAGGVLHVGPESAGADPGPVCYGASDVPTVTDAHVLLGHIDQGAFLAGAVPLNKDAVRQAFERVGAELGTTAERAAQGVLDVARAQMRRAIGVMTMQRGQDPRRIPLVAFGGAGGLHAAALAESLRMRGALIPLHPGALSARGMTSADATRDLSRTALAPLTAWNTQRRRGVQRALAEEARNSLREEGFSLRSIRLEHGLDLRYAGQSYEIHVAEGRSPDEAFHRAHETLYGYALPDREVELVCLRTRARVSHEVSTPRATRKRALPASKLAGARRAVFARPCRAVIVPRDALSPGHTFSGPALVEEYSGTTLVPPGWTATVTPGSHLYLQAKT